MWEYLQRTRNSFANRAEEDGEQGVEEIWRQPQNTSVEVCCDLAHPPYLKALASDVSDPDVLGLRAVA